MGDVTAGQTRHLPSVDQPSEMGEVEKPTGRRLISASGIGVQYQIGPTRESVDARIFSFLQRGLKARRNWVLKDISFEGHAGDIIGIIGENGAGKTTLCRVISGMLRPDAGRMDVFADVSALLSLGTGFNPVLTGRENIFLNGMMLGVSRSLLNERFEEIRDFSGLGRFINAPLKTYSSGMISRLAFSVASTVAPEILILDETLSVGDFVFAKKAAERMQQLVHQAGMVLLVTHRLDFVQKHCTRAIWLKDGQLAANGKPDEVVGAYLRSFSGRPVVRSTIIYAPTKTKAKGRTIIDAKDVGVCFPVKDACRIHSQNLPQPDGGDTIGNAFWPLKHVSFQVSEGEILGIIGLNGAGKTTICKLLAGILKPDRGEVTITGKVTALLNIGVGFNSELTGRDNIFLNGMLMGIPKRRIQDCYDDIVAFSGVDGYIDEPIKHYSTGMRARLAFSIAVMIEPDILILDEVLSVGDATFHLKAAEKMQNLLHQSKAVIVVTHNMEFLKSVCTRAIWLSEGTIRYDGPPSTAVDRYQKQS